LNSAFEDPQFSPIRTPLNYLTSNPKKLSKHFVSYLKIFKPPNNPISDPQNPIQPSKKSPKHPISDLQNSLFQIPRKSHKHHVSNLEKPNFRPAKHHVLDSKIIFQAPKKSYFKAEMKPCFEPKKSLFHTQKFVFQTPKKTMFQTEENIISNPQKPKSRCHSKKMNQKHES
jgi:hypothetical protein